MYYAVKKGKIPGIYNTWAECQKQTSGFSGAQFHKFETYDKAKDYIENAEDINYVNAELDKETFDEKNFKYPLAFVDGSNNKKTKAVGYGIVFLKEKNDNPIKIIGQAPKEYWSMNNVAGEISGAMRAIEEGVKLQLKDIHIYYDYTGIEFWGRGIWSSKLPFVQKYIEFCKLAKNYGLNIHFIKVPAHTNVELNELADKYAKESVGII